MSLKNKHTKQLLKMLKQQRYFEMLRAEYGCDDEPGVWEADDAPKKVFGYKCTGFSVAELKAELSTREHVPNKKEAKALRQAKAKESKRERW